MDGQEPAGYQQTSDRGQERDEFASWHAQSGGGAARDASEFWAQVRAASRRDSDQAAMAVLLLFLSLTERRLCWACRARKMRLGWTEARTTSRMAMGMRRGSGRDSRDLDRTARTAPDRTARTAPDSFGQQTAGQQTARQQAQSQRLATTLQRWEGRCWAVVLNPPNNKSLN